MINRASGPLLAAYLMTFIAGIFFLGTPSLVLEDATEYNQLLVTWGLFYLAGGLIASLSLITRLFMRNSIALWYFEMSGIALVVTANFVYAYALARSGLYYHEGNIIAFALVILSFSFGLVARSVETFRLVRILTKAAKYVRD
jgi:hypothetical protein